MIAKLSRWLFTRIIDRRPKTIRHASNNLRFRPGFDPLEVRECPATWTGAVSTDGANPANWVDEIMPPDDGIGLFDPAAIVGFANCDLPGDFTTLQVLSGYPGKITAAPGYSEATIAGGEVVVQGSASITLGMTGGSMTVTGSGSFWGLDISGGSLLVQGAAHIGDFLDQDGGSVSLQAGGTIDNADITLGALILGNDVTAGSMSLSGGSISQATGADLTIDGDTDWLGDHFEWTGGSINVAGNAADVIVTGATTLGLIAPYGAGTVVLGSSLTIAAGALVTMKAGTVEFTAVGEINVEADSGIAVDPGPQDEILLKASGGTITAHQINILPNAYVELLSGNWIHKGPVLNRGSFTLTSGTSAEFYETVDGGQGAPSFKQTEGITKLYHDALLSVHHEPGGMLITGGKLSTIATLYGASASIRGNLTVTGGEVVIGDGSVPHIFGTLYVYDGNVVWTGGTYRPVVEGDRVNGFADLWYCAGSFTMGGTAALAPGTIDGEGNEMTAPQQANWTWLIIRGDLGVTSNNNAPSITGPWVNDPVPGNPVKFWQIKST